MKTSLDLPKSSPDAYEREFVRTVLRLTGITGMPTAEQFELAKHTFDEYCLRVKEARRRDLLIDSDWLTGRMPEQAAVERAFLFVRYDSVLNTTGLQTKALYDWLLSGATH